MVDHKKMKEVDSHWKEVMDLAEKYGFIGQAVGGTAVLLTHKNQLEADGEETYLRRQRSLFKLDMEANMILGCMTELPCLYQKDFDGAEHCMKEEGNCEYQILNSEDKKKENPRLTAKDSQGYWSLKGVLWESLCEGQIITKNIQQRLTGALCKLKDYEDTGYSPENVEHLRYILEDAVMELEKCQGETELTKEIWHYLKEY